MKKQKYPPGWNEKRVRALINHYDNQTEDEAVAEDEAAYRAAEYTMMSVPTVDRGESTWPCALVRPSDTPMMPITSPTPAARPSARWRGRR